MVPDVQIDPGWLLLIYTVPAEPVWPTAPYPWYIALGVVDQLRPHASSATFFVGHHRPARRGCLQPKRNSAERTGHLGTRSCATAGGHPNVFGAAVRCGKARGGSARFG